MPLFICSQAYQPLYPKPLHHYIPYPDMCALFQEQWELLNAAFPHREAWHRDYLLSDAGGFLPRAPSRGMDAAGDDLSYLYYAHADGILSLAQLAVQLQKVLNHQRILPSLADNRVDVDVNHGSGSQMMHQLLQVDEASEHVVDGVWLMEWALHYFADKPTKITVYDPILKTLLIMYDQQQWKPQKQMLASMLALLAHKPLPGLSMLPVYAFYDSSTVQSRILPMLSPQIFLSALEWVSDGSTFIQDYRGLLARYGRQGVDWNVVLQCILKSVHFGLIEEGTWIEIH